MEETKTNAGQGFGVAGLIIGIIAIIMSFVPCVGIIAIVPGIVAVVFSAIALNQANKGNGPKGLIISAFVIAIFAISIAILWGFVFSRTINNSTWWKTEFTKAFDKENNVDDNEAVKEFGADLEKVLENLESAQDTGTIKKIQLGEKMTDADFDKFLIDYEKLIQEVIKLQDKYKKGDELASKAYTKVSIKLTEISLKLVAASSTLTPEQYKRLKEINNKYKDKLDLNTLENDK